jgi:hypothetical protein
MENQTTLSAVNDANASPPFSALLLKIYSSDFRRIAVAVDKQSNAANERIDTKVWLDILRSAHQAH